MSPHAVAGHAVYRGRDGSPVEDGRNVDGPTQRDPHVAGDEFPRCISPVENRGPSEAIDGLTRQGPLVAEEIPEPFQPTRSELGVVIRAA